MSEQARKERKERLIEGHLYLVHEAAVRAQHLGGDDPMDTATMAMVGLIKAAAHYVQWGLDALEADNVRAVPFETFARNYVGNEVDRYIERYEEYSRP